MDEEKELGKLEFWQKAYEDELDNFVKFGDEGEAWFGEHVVETLVQWTIEFLRATFDNPLGGTILDVGCGNGHVLTYLHQCGFKHLTGTDYSENSISLCRQIMSSKSIKDITLQVDDILNSKLYTKYDVIFDKGTFDAISLTAKASLNKSQYARSVEKLMKEEGILIITSCNFTLDELLYEFGNRFCFLDSVQNYKSFSFGGNRGTVVSTAAFRKK